MGLPSSAKVLPLSRGLKRPLSGGHGHLNAVPMDSLDMGLVPAYANWGVVLDGQFLVVDIDAPDAVAGPWAELTPTWTQRTGRGGTHHVYTYTDTGRNRKFVAGDVKIHGYIVGPGSVVNGNTYTVVDDRDPVPAPQWLVDYVNQGGDEQLTQVEDGIPAGRHDEYYFRMAYFLRSEYGLSEAAIARVLASGPGAILQDTDLHNPFTQRDFERHAKSAVRRLPVVLGDINPYPNDLTIPETPEPKDWVLPGFIPAAALTVLYGAGKIGKSSFASWLVARHSQNHGRALFVASGEESFDLFVRRCRLNGLTPGNLFYYEQAFVLPGDAAKLATAIKEVNASFVYIDALYSHFGVSQGENDAVRARARLTPLAQIAADTGAAILGTIHENKSGGILGSLEMMNVSRSTLHATGGRGKNFTVWPAGANGWAPDYGLAFTGKAHDVIDKTTGEILTFTDVFGEPVKESVWVLTLAEKVPLAPTTVQVDEIEIPIKDKILEYLAQEPRLKYREIARWLDTTEDYVKKIASQEEEK